MSGQPNRYSSDAANFRQDYMNSLNLQASIDDMNLKANQVYKATGQLPPQSGLPDTRTTAEKLADTTKLKVSLISELKPIAGPQFAQLVIQYIENSNLNANGALFIYFAQNVKQLVEHLKKKYGIGIKGDANDAEQFKLYVEHLYNETKSFMGSVKSSFNRPYSQVKSMSIGDIDSIKYEFELIANQITSHYYKNEKFGPLIDSIHQIIKAISELIPTTAQIKEFRDEFMNGRTEIIDKYNENGAETNTSIEIMELYNNLEQILESLPPVASVFSAYEQLKSSMRNRSPNLTIDILTRIRNMFPSLQRIRQFSTYADTYLNHLPPTPPQPAPPIPPAHYDDDSSSSSILSDVTAPPRTQYSDTPELDSGLISTDISGMLPSIGGQQSPRPLPSESDEDDLPEEIARFSRLLDRTLEVIDRLDPHDEIDNDLSMLSRQITESRSQLEQRGVRRLSPDLAQKYDRSMSRLRAKRDSYRRHHDSAAPRPRQPSPEPEPRSEGPPSPSPIHPSEDHSQRISHIKNQISDKQHLVDVTKDLLGGPFDEQQKETYRRRLQQTEDQIAELERELHSIGGSGLKKRPGRPKGSGIARPFTDKVDTSRGIQPDRRYISFGKYLINTSKLGDNTFAIKTQKGIAIPGYPSTRISPEFTSVIKKIVGNGVPSYNELSALNNDEKNYLYNVSKKAEIVDKLSIPTPSKDQAEKDIHDFNVMKGEIMSGNDNADLIRKFKIHMMKLSKSGVLPKKEVNEILSDLLDLGF